MIRRDSDRPGLLRWGSLGLAVLVTLVAVSGAADARPRKARQKPAHAANAY